MGLSREQLKCVVELMETVGEWDGSAVQFASEVPVMDSTRKVLGSLVIGADSCWVFQPGEG